MENRSGEVVSAQVAIFDDIDTKALTKEDFRLTNGQSFLIKNEGTEPIVLDVIPAGREEDTFVKCSFDMGWNPELVRAIKATSLSNLKIKYGY